MINIQLIRNTIFVYDLSEGYYNMLNIGLHKGNNFL